MMAFSSVAMLIGYLLVASPAAGLQVHDVQATHANSARAAVASSLVTIKVPVGPPAAASPPMDPAFPSFAFEETSFFRYAGPSGSPNQFSNTLMNTIARRTNVRPLVRVGGTSLDRSKYNRGQQAAFQYPPNQIGNVPKNVTIGPPFFQSFRNLPNAQYIFDIPLGPKNLANSVTFAQDGYKVIKPQLYGLEIGNEPQFYPDRVRPSNYSPQDYIDEFTRYSNAVNNALGLSGNQRIYQAVGTGSPPAYEYSDNVGMQGPFYPNHLFNVGLQRLAPRIQSVSLHYYQTSATSSQYPGWQLRNELLNHTITKKKTSFFLPAVQYFRQNYPNIPVVLGEVASSLNPTQNDYALESVFGAALWQVDWMLYAASIGIRRVHWQQISSAAFDLWQPTNFKGRVPAVLPPYYAMLFAADFVGANAGSRPVRIAEVDLHIDKLTSYVAYEKSPGVPLRVAVVNMRFFSGTESAGNPRNYQPLRLNLPKTAKSIVVERMGSIRGATAGSGANGGDDQNSGISWQGMRYSYESGGNPQRVVSDTNTKVVNNGVAEVAVRDSEAIMVTIRY